MISVTGSERTHYERFGIFGEGRFIRNGGFPAEAFRIGLDQRDAVDRAGFDRISGGVVLSFSFTADDSGREELLSRAGGAGGVALRAGGGISAGAGERDIASEQGAGERRDGDRAGCGVVGRLAGGD